MSIRKRPVSIHRIPDEITSTTQMELLRRSFMQVENQHPRFVLDCSNIKTMTPSVMRLLIGCLEEAMKLNGDVRLARLQPEAEAVFRQSGVGRLFELYDSVYNAVRSYQVSPVSTAPLSFQIAATEQETKYAA